MQIFKIKSPMEDTYDELVQETIENGHAVNFIFNYSTGVCVEVLYDDVPYAYYYGHDINFHFNYSIGVCVKLLYDGVPFECFYGKKACVTPSMINITVNDSETIIIPLSKVKYFKIKKNGEN